MREEESLLIHRLSELAARAYRQGAYTRTDFLTPAEQALLTRIAGTLDAPYTLFGGAPDCERKCASFGSEALCGYAETSPIACLLLAPSGGKFAGALTHRDYLGALMNLGLARDALGDIVLGGGGAYVFLTESAARLALASFTRVGREPVTCTRADAPICAEPVLSAQTVQVASVRLDALLARAFHLSREESAALFRQQRVFLNGAAEESPSRAPAPGDIVSARGYGRFRFSGISGTTKKGRLNAVIERYGG